MGVSCPQNYKFTGFGNPEAVITSIHDKAKQWVKAKRDAGERDVPNITTDETVTEYELFAAKAQLQKEIDSYSGWGNAAFAFEGYRTANAQMSLLDQIDNEKIYLGTRIFRGPGLREFAGKKDEFTAEDVTAWQAQCDSAK